MGSIFPFQIPKIKISTKKLKKINNLKLIFFLEREYQGKGRSTLSSETESDGNVILEEFFETPYEDMNHGFVIQYFCQEFIEESESLPLDTESQTIPEMPKTHTFLVLNNDIKITLKLRAHQFKNKETPKNSYQIFSSKEAKLTEKGKKKIDIYKGKQFRIHMQIYTESETYFQRKSIILTIHDDASVDMMDKVIIYPNPKEIMIIKGTVDLEDFECIPSAQYAGLVNNGMTCYMNSLLQTFFQIEELRRQVFKLPYEKMKEKAGNWEWVRAFQDLFYTMMMERRKAAETKDLTDAFGWNTAEVFTQQDVQEFSCILLDGFEKKSKEAKMDDFVENLFRGKMENYIECVNVDFQSTREEVFYDIQLAVKNLDTLYKSLDEYTKPEKLEGDNKYEAEGFGKQDALKGIRFLELPAILLLHLRRFEYDFQYDSNVKILTKNRLEEEINLSKYVKGVKEYSAEHDYCLFGILTHMGSTAGSGHYITFIRPGMQEWYKFNDEYVSQVSFGYIRKHAEGGEMEKINVDYRNMRTKISNVQNYSTAYMLVYIQKNKVAEILKKVKTEEIPKQVKMNFEQKMVAERKNIYMHENLEILCTSLDLVKNMEGPGCLVQFKAIYDDSNLRRFIRNSSLRFSLVIKKTTTLHEFMKKIEKETGLVRGTYGIWKFVKRQKWLSYFLTPDNFKQLRRKKMGGLLQRDLFPILLIEPFDPKIKIFRKMKKEESQMNKREYEDLLNANELTWNHNENLPEAPKKNIMLFNSLKSYKTCLVIQKEFSDDEIKIKSRKFFNKSTTSLADIYDEFGLDEKMPIFFESFNPKEGGATHFREYYHNEEVLISSFCDNVNIIVSLKSKEQLEQGFRYLDSAAYKVQIRVHNEAKKVSKEIITDLRKPTSEVNKFLIFFSFSEPFQVNFSMMRFMEINSLLR